MFDTYVKRTTTAPAYPQTIHEHRAPTDESIRLLKEMEDKVKDNFVTSIIVEENIVNGAITIESDYTPDYNKWIFISGIASVSTLTFLIVDDSVKPGSGPLSEFLTPADDIIWFHLMYSGAPPGTTWNIHCALKEFRINNQYRNPNEIIKSRFIKPTIKDPTLECYIPMDESSGTVIKDRVSNTE